MSVPADLSALRNASTHVRSSSSATSGTAAAEMLPDDLLVEILSRVSAKSICRFKCVSKHWLTLINDPHHRKKLPQTLAGFFYSGKRNYKYDDVPESSLRFISTSESCCPLFFPNLAFLPNQPSVAVLDSCNGLLLCRWSDFGDNYHFVVCNPGTEQWVVLPDPSHDGKVRLGFDPAVSSQFYVFMLLLNFNNIYGVDIYSSETRRWVHRENRWTETVSFLNCPSPAVFLNKCLHFHAYGSKSSLCIAALDTEGQTWKTFGIPDNLDLCFIQHSQGSLQYAGFEKNYYGFVVRILVYVLEDYDSKEWVLKHSVETTCIFGVTHVTQSRQLEIRQIKSWWTAIHPDCNLIFFFAGHGTTLMCYNIDRREAKVICSLDFHLPLLSYVPLYAELQSLYK